MTTGIGCTHTARERRVQFDREEKVVVVDAEALMATAPLGAPVVALLDDQDGPVTNNPNHPNRITLITLITLTTLITSQP